MFSLAGKRSAIAQSKCLTARAIPARAVAVAQPSNTNRDFHSTPTNAAFRPTWMPMRVKTPWIDALTQSRKAARDVKEGVEAPPLVKPDLTPKKMSDGRYSAVCMLHL
jgi:acyl-coenzyme A thioesterase 9